jgi:hypothetical protein
VLAAAEEGIGDQAAAVDYLELQVTILYWGLRRADQLWALLARARSWWDHPGWHQRLDTLRLLGQDAASPAVAAVASEQIYAASGADEDVRQRVAPVHASNLFFSGRVREAYELAHRIRPAVPLRGLADEIAFVMWSTIALESGQGWAELETWASAALADGIRLGDRAAAGRAALALGGLRFSQARFAQASRWLAEAELQLERHDAGGLLTVVNSMQVGVACFTGDLAALDPALDRCHTAAGHGDPLPHQLPHLARAQAWALLGHGDPPRAQALLLDAAARLTEMPVYAARLTYEALRAGAPPRQVAPRLQNLAGRCDGRLTAAYAAHATARAASDAEALLTVTDEMEAIGALRYATEAAAHAAAAFLAVGRPPLPGNAQTRGDQPPAAVVPDGRAGQRQALTR